MRTVPILTELRAARLSRGLRLEDVAAAAGISRTRASIVERNPNLGTAPELAALHGAISRLAETGQSSARMTPEQSRAREILNRLGALLDDSNL